jgi:hypothetical protein
MSYQPLYTITSSIVSLVADISERMGYLSAHESDEERSPPSRVTAEGTGWWYWEVLK